MGVTATVVFIVLHMVDGMEVQINPKLITHLLSSTGENKTLVEGVKCVVRLADGLFVSVVEDCNRVRELIEGEEQP